MGEKGKKNQNPNENKKKPISSSSDVAAAAFKVCSEVKEISFGGQFMVKSFTVRRSTSMELLQLLSITTAISNTNDDKKSQKRKKILASTTAYLPTNFTILAHRAWHTLTLGLGTKKSKVILFVFESENMKSEMERIWPTLIPLGEVNTKLIRGTSSSSSKCEMARFKFRKGCITFYVYAVRKNKKKMNVCGGFSAGDAASDDLKTILDSILKLKDFLDHTSMLALPTQPSITY